MATTVVQIFNMALATCGSTQTVSTEDEESPQGRSCRLFYDEVRKFVNAGAPWRFSLDWTRLAVLAERDYALDWTNSDPAPGWRFAYGLPTKMVSPFFLFDYQRFELGLHAGVPALMTDAESPVLRYVTEQPNVAYWSVGFTNAVVSLLAFRLSPSINAKRGQRNDLRDEAFEFIAQARTDAANSQEADLIDALPDALIARGYSDNLAPIRYFFPFQDLNGVTL